MFVKKFALLVALALDAAALSAPRVAVPSGRPAPPPATRRRAATFGFDEAVPFEWSRIARRSTADEVRKTVRTAAVVGAGAAALRAAAAACPSPAACVAAYNGALAARPYATKALGTGLTYLASDLTAQLLEGGDRPRFRRALKFAAVGAFWVGPLLAAWFQVMDFALPGRAPTAVLGKIVADQVLQGPFMIATMFLWTGLMNGKRLGDVATTLKAQLKPTWVKSVYVWSPIQALQQAVVPLEYRVAVANLVSYFWDTYLAHEMKPDAEDVADASDADALAFAEVTRDAAIIDDSDKDDRPPITIRDPSLLFDFVLA